jgi:hypothetical protein
MSYENDPSRDRNSLVDELEDHIDEVVTICTERCCFTGLLVGVNDDAVKLITRGFGCPSRDFFGKVTIIRIRQIEAVTFCNTTV